MVHYPGWKQNTSNTYSHDEPERDISSLKNEKSSVRLLIIKGRGIREPEPDQEDEVIRRISHLFHHSFFLEL